MTRRKEAESYPREYWVRFALEQARLVVSHLESEVPDRRFVCSHALTVMEAASCGEDPFWDRPWREDGAWAA